MAVTYDSRTYNTAIPSCISFIIMLVMADILIFAMAHGRLRSYLREYKKVNRASKVVKAKSGRVTG